MMAHGTTYSGGFFLDRPLAPHHHAYLTRFSQTRRMKRDPRLAEQLPDPLRVAVGLPIGLDGAYFVGSEDDLGQVRDPSLVDYNTPPGMPALDPIVRLRDTLTPDEYSDRLAEYGRRATDARLSGNAQPGLWCQWIPSDDGRAIVWDRGEKFTDPYGWIEYLLRHFLGPWGYIANGRVDWQGPDAGDVGSIFVTDNAL